MKSKGLIIGVCVVDVLLIALFVFLYVGQDRFAPVIAFSENNIVYTEDMDKDLLLEGVTAIDEEDGDVSDSLLIEKISVTAQGDVIVTYAALDESNNVTKTSRVFEAQGVKGAAIEENEAEIETATEAETELETESTTETTAEDETETETEGDASENDEQENNDNEEEAGADRDHVENDRTNVAPVLRLNQEIVTVKAGVAGINWNDCISQLSDDHNNREELFSNLSMEGSVDLTTPGEYPVKLYTKDSEGTESERQAIVVKVE